MWRLYVITAKRTDMRFLKEQQQKTISEQQPLDLEHMAASYGLWENTCLMAALLLQEGVHRGSVHPAQQAIPLSQPWTGHRFLNDHTY